MQHSKSRTLSICELLASKRKGNAAHDLDAFGLDLGFRILWIVVDVAETKGIATFHKNRVIASRKARGNFSVDVLPLATSGVDREPLPRPAVVSVSTSNTLRHGEPKHKLILFPDKSPLF